MSTSASFWERLNDLGEITGFIMLWSPMIVVAGMVGFIAYEEARWEFALVMLLGAIGIALWIIPLGLIVLAVEVVRFL